MINQNVSNLSTINIEKYFMNIFIQKMLFKIFIEKD